MKFYDLQPTHENLLETFLDDSLKRNADVFAFADILNNMDTSCSIALDGAWGSGKTFFVKQTKMFIDAYHPHPPMSEDDCCSIQSVWDKAHPRKKFEAEPQVCVYYDAWENDNDDDPILSLIYSILQQVQSDYSFKPDGDFFKIIGGILEFFSGKNWSALIKSFKQGSPLDGITEAKELKSKIDEFLNQLLPESGNRLVIFIDELDRCKPSFAVKLLERIKHHFCNDRITFVFSINTLELQHTIKKHYGDDFDACKYLDRFFDLRMSLPKPDMRRFFDKIGFQNTLYYVDIVANEVIKEYDFSIREIAKYIKLLKIALYKDTHSESERRWALDLGGSLHFAMMIIAPIMIGVKMHDFSKYEAFLGGQDSSPLIDIACRMDLQCFERLYSPTETHIADDKQGTYVSVKEKMSQVYRAIFQETKEGSVRIGKISFGYHTKEALLRIVSLLSESTDFSVE